MRRVVGNLDFEQDLAQAGALSPAAVLRVAPLATLLRVFADEGDRVWTPAPVDPSTMPEVKGLPRPVLESGPLAALPACADVLVWGENGPGGAEPRGRSPCGADVPLWRHLWHLPRPPAEKAREANDRRFCLKVARDFGCALPGTEYVTAVAPLARHLAQQKHDRFVLKAPFSAAGRARMIFRKEELGDAAVARRAEALFARYGGALLEPWMNRTDDFGSLGLIDDRGVAFLGVHRQHISAEGSFRGITLRPLTFPDGVSKEDAAALTVAARRVGEALHEFGYRGPYSVDSWRYLDLHGKARLQPMGEINARMSMGLVARAASERVFGRDCVDEVSLRFDDETGPGDALVLLASPRVTLTRTAVE